MLLFVRNGEQYWTSKRNYDDKSIWFLDAAMLGCKFVNDTNQDDVTEYIFLLLKDGTVQ